MPGTVLRGVELKVSPLSAGSRKISASSGGSDGSLFIPMPARVAPSAKATAAAAFSVTAEYRERWGEDAFRSLSSVAFNEADADQSGTMELIELKETLKKVRISLTDEEVARVMARYDHDKSGTINEDEWHRLLGDLLDGSLMLQEDEGPPMLAHQRSRKPRSDVVHELQGVDTELREDAHQLSIGSDEHAKTMARMCINCAWQATIAC